MVYGCSILPTTMIVGAGASAEAGLPTGDKLTQQIAELVDLWAEHGRPTKGDSQIHHVIQQLARLDEWQPNRFYGSGRALAEAMELAPSIDTFLESHRHNREYVLLGKLGIAKAIAVAERDSKMTPINDRSEPFQLRSLSQNLVRQPSPTNVYGYPGQPTGTRIREFIVHRV